MRNAKEKSLQELAIQELSKDKAAQIKGGTNDTFIEDEIEDDTEGDIENDFAVEAGPKKGKKKNKLRKSIK